MPSTTLHLTPPEASSSEYLPEYGTPSIAPPSYRIRASHELSTILEMEEELDDELNEEARTDTEYMPGRYSSMVPQALLVDASATLCAYLHFTSLQARMALQQKTSSNTLAAVCASSTEVSDYTLMHNCAAALAHYQNTASLAEVGCLHYLVIAAVLAKALFGWLVLTHARRYLRPFDYLVVSGGAHCLMLYTMFFVPVAGLLQGAAVAETSIFTRALIKVFWLLIVCAACALAHKAASIALSFCRRSFGRSTHVKEELILIGAGRLPKAA